MGSREKSTFSCKDVILDEEFMLQEKSEMEDKAQGGASDSLADTQEKELSSQRALKVLMGQKRTPHIQMETNRSYSRVT